MSGTSFLLRIRLRSIACGAGCPLAKLPSYLIFPGMLITHFLPISAGGIRISLQKGDGDIPGKSLVQWFFGGIPENLMCLIVPTSQLAHLLQELSDGLGLRPFTKHP